MAVIIDGWDKLPQNCYDCDLHNYHECALTGNSIEDYYNGETREPHCPLKEVPIGKWEHKQTDSFYHVIGQCSNCKARYRINNYCPNCGADMRGRGSNAR